MGPPFAERRPNLAGMSVLEMLITMGLISILAYTSMILVTAALRASAGTRDAEVGTDQMSVIRTDLAGNNGANCATGHLREYFKGLGFKINLRFSVWARHQAAVALIAPVYSNS